MRRYLRGGGWIDCITAGGIAYLISIAIKDRP